MTAIVSLGDYIPDLLVEINPPGQNIYPNMSDDEALTRLIGAFWTLRLSGLDFLSSFTCTSAGDITPQPNPPPMGIAGSYLPQSFYLDDMTGAIGREIIQAIVLFAHMKILISVMENAKVATTYRAGPVEASTQYSAQVFQAALKAVMEQASIVISRLSDLGSTNVQVLDAVIDSTVNIRSGQSWYVR